MSGWTEERREQYRRMMNERKPWLWSTGPTSPEGRARVARNAIKAGLIAAVHGRVRAYLRSVESLLRESSDRGD